MNEEVLVKPIRLLIADDHTVVRKGLAALLDGKPSITVVGGASNGNEAVSRARTLKPDVILLDLEMPEKDGLTAIREITAEDPQARILVLTSFGDEGRAYSAIKGGALGYLLKDSQPNELIRAIHDVYQGRPSIHPSIALRLVRELKQAPPSYPVENPLTAREVVVLKLIAQGLTNQEIADKLVISPRTVTTHVSHILGKLHLANRTQAALYALREGLADLD